MQHPSKVNGTGSSWFALVVLFYSRSVEEHLTLLGEVFARLRKTGLKIKPSMSFPTDQCLLPRKCGFC